MEGGVGNDLEKARPGHATTPAKFTLDLDPRLRSFCVEKIINYKYKFLEPWNRESSLRVWAACMGRRCPDLKFDFIFSPDNHDGPYIVTTR